MPRAQNEPTRPDETIAVLEARLAAAGHELLAGSVATRASAALCRSSDPRFIATVELQSVTALQARPSPVPHSLVVLSEATRMLAEARTLPEVRQVLDIAQTALVYLKKRHLGIEAQNHAGVIAVEATIRLGEILTRMKVTGARDAGAGGSRYRSGTVNTLADLNTTKRESADAQALAAQAEEVRGWLAATTKRGKPVTTTRAARVARDAKAKKERIAQAAVAIPPPGCDLRLGDFRVVLADIPDGSVDVVLTDPPYPGMFLPLWTDLAILAKRVLKPDGLLVSMSGQLHLPEVIARLSEHLLYRWVTACFTPGAANVVHARNVASQWKPVLIYGSSARRLHDVARSDTADKAHHDWGQSESGMADLLRLVADPGQVICDPFLGGGTTAVVALAYGCSFIGAEVGRESYEKSLVRVAR
jgi:16S rRNA G966 N2-methylase RsmD